MPSFMVLLGIILILFLFLGKQAHDELCNNSKIHVEADIASLGIRIASRAQICILLFIALLGTFHALVTMAKEETLAARWQVVVTVVCQTFGLLLLGIVVNDFGNDMTEICLSAAWWGDVGACTESPASNTIVRRDMKAFWIYYAFRWLSLFQSSFHSLMSMSAFHKAENNNELHLDNLTFPQLLLESVDGCGRELIMGPV
ncbi:uncharacterized protein LY79DRAFT_660404 [Colletotrichum navitas]|uniref:Integral membrane protein n=1 Tax=Colletotrichum navitas TaxID=681940 RepID=A0AAD8PVL5_9PEZI|nr:uncharacterized protein LY79DRAFT_660404 [Colletotrichum navitas]KAK1585512.1 hypothetical protein LY79DRAFT_660404 [Colletotrichum navitas]